MMIYNRFKHILETDGICEVQFDNIVILLCALAGDVVLYDKNTYAIDSCRIVIKLMKLYGVTPHDIV